MADLGVGEGLEQVDDEDQRVVASDADLGVAGRAEGVRRRDDREYPAADLLAVSAVSRPGSSYPVNRVGLPAV